EVLAVGVQCDPVMHIGVQQQLRSAHDEIRIDLLALGCLARNTLQPILIALSVDGGDQRRSSARERSDERRYRTQEGRIDVHFGSKTNYPIPGVHVIGAHEIRGWACSDKVADCNGVNPLASPAS